MSAQFNLQGKSLLVSKPDSGREDLDALPELLEITHRYSDNDTFREAVEIDKITIQLICNFSKKSYNLLSKSDYDGIKHAITDVLERDSVNIPYVVMKKSGRELIVCELAIKDKPFWRVVRTNNFTFRELNYLASVLKEAGIYSFTKNTHL